MYMNEAIKKENRQSFVPASALIRERSKSLELEFPPSYSYSSTISCCSVGSQPPRTTEMSVVILSIRPTAHFCRTLKRAPENNTVNLLTREICTNDNLYILPCPFHHNMYKKYT